MEDANVLSMVSVSGIPLSPIATLITDPNKEF